MKLKSISCDQFAGIRDRSVEFGDGVNVVVGANESGKSTLVGLISRTLFRTRTLSKSISPPRSAGFHSQATRLTESCVLNLTAGAIPFQRSGAQILAARSRPRMG